MVRSDAGVMPAWAGIRCSGEFAVDADLANEGIDARAALGQPVLDAREIGLDNESGEDGLIHRFLDLGDGALHTIGDLAVARVSSGVRRPIMAR